MKTLFLTTHVNKLLTFQLVNLEPQFSAAINDDVVDIHSYK